MLALQVSTSKPTAGSPHFHSRSKRVDRVANSIPIRIHAGLRKSRAVWMRPEVSAEVWPANDVCSRCFCGVPSVAAKYATKTKIIGIVKTIVLDHVAAGGVEVNAAARVTAYTVAREVVVAG